MDLIRCDWFTDILIYLDEWREKKIYEKAIISWVISNFQMVNGQKILFLTFFSQLEISEGNQRYIEEICQ